MSSIQWETKINLAKSLDRCTELETQNDGLQRRVRALEMQLFDATLRNGAKPAAQNTAPIETSRHVARRHTRKSGLNIGIALIFGISIAWVCITTVISLLH